MTAESDKRERADRRNAQAAIVRNETRSAREERQRHAAPWLEAARTRLRNVAAPCRVHHIGITWDPMWDGDQYVPCRDLERLEIPYRIMPIEVHGRFLFRAEFRKAALKAAKKAAPN